MEITNNKRTIIIDCTDYTQETLFLGYASDINSTQLQFLINPEFLNLQNVCYQVTFYKNTGESATAQVVKNENKLYFPLTEDITHISSVNEGHRGFLQFFIIQTSGVAFTAIENPTTPKANGYYELRNGEYVLTEDVTVVVGKTYYEPDGEYNDSPQLVFSSSKFPYIIEDSLIRNDGATFEYSRDRLTALEEAASIINNLQIEAVERYSDGITTPSDDDGKVPSSKVVRKALNLKENMANKTNDLSSNFTDHLKYPSALSVKTALNLKEDTANKTTTLTNSNTQYPTSNAVKTVLDEKMNFITTPSANEKPTGGQIFFYNDKFQVGDGSTTAAMSNTDSLTFLMKSDIPYDTGSISSKNYNDNTVLMTGSYQIVGNMCTIVCHAPYRAGQTSEWYELPAVSLSDVSTIAISPFSSQNATFDKMYNIKVTGAYVGIKKADNIALSNDTYVDFTLTYKYGGN